MGPSSAVIFHLSNHYALIFALREWTDAQCSRQVRQVLTARKGQRPSAWVDFEEARETMIKWSGYKLLRVDFKGGSISAAGAGGDGAARRCSGGEELRSGTS